MLQRKISVAAATKAASSVGSWLVLASVLAACGQKGALTLPKPVTPAAPAASQSAPAPAPATPR